MGRKADVKQLGRPIRCRICRRTMLNSGIFHLKKNGDFICEHCNSTPILKVEPETANLVVDTEEFAGLIPIKFWLMEAIDNT